MSEGVRATLPEGSNCRLSCFDLGVALTLTLAAITGGGFALAGNGSDDDDPSLADQWKLTEASGWPGGFSLRLPQGWQLNELDGIDSYVGEIIGGGGRLTFDFGWYSSSLVDDDDPKHIVTYEEIGGRQAKLVRPRDDGSLLITGVYFEDFDGNNLDVPSQNRLQISGEGLNPDQQETALAIFRTIRPLTAESPGEPEPSGDQHPVTSRMSTPLEARVSSAEPRVELACVFQSE